MSDEWLANMGDTIVGVYYKSPEQEEEIDVAFYKQLEVTSWSQMLILMEDFNHCDIAWKSALPGTHSVQFPAVYGRELSDVADGGAKEENAVLELVLTKKEKQVCIHYKVMEFRDWIHRIEILYLKTANFDFKDLLGSTP